MWGMSTMETIKNKAQDSAGGIAVTLPVGYVYNIHWSTGIDWDHTLLVP